MILLGVFAAMGKKRELLRLVRKPAFQRLPRTKIVETLLEVHLFAGFPATIEGFFQLRQLIKSPSSGQKRITPRERRRKGIGLCRRIYGRNFERLMQNLDSLNPELSGWVLEDGYGKVLARPGLGIVERELIAVAILAAQGWRRQLNSHVRGALNLGVRPQEIKEIGHIIAHYAQTRRLRMFEKTVNEAVAGLRRLKTS
ncbi:MAG: carboxymuconolactone decarboxylase family protein [Ignavibacteriae bacterium]|nr:carboxymuconolactone decarboxylase family protein [Ignavibacteriota bacterium]